MSNQFGLKREVIEKIQNVFSGFAEIESAILYGSRAKGNYKNGSDIDLTLKIKSKDSFTTLLEVSNALDDLDTPYTFDISLLSHIKNDDLLEHIKRVGVVFYKAEEC